MRAALEVVRAGEGSTLRAWNVAQDSVTEHDRRHARLREYFDRGTGGSREVARSIRPHLEAFVRVAYPGDFPPGTLLRPFLNTCRHKLAKPSEILGEDAIRNLEQLVDYANRFHHDTNPAWETEVINDGELRGFVNRALTFVRK